MCLFIIFVTAVCVLFLSLSCDPVSVLSAIALSFLGDWLQAFSGLLGRHSNGNKGLEKSRREITWYLLENNTKKTKKFTQNVLHQY